MTTLKLSDFGIVQRDLNDLSDVDISSPQAGEFLKWDSVNWINDIIKIGDVENLQSTIDAITVSSLADVSLVNLTDGDILVYNATDGLWVSAPNEVPSLSPVAYSGDFSDLSNKLINNMTDVTLDTATVDQVLTFDGSIWINKDLPFIPLSIAELNDVDADAPTEGDILLYDSALTQWISTASNAGVNATTIYVDPTGSDSNGNGSELRPFQSISRALDEIGDGTFDTDLAVNWAIKVGQGTYTESINVPVFRSVNFYAVGIVTLGDGGDDIGTRGNVNIPHSNLSFPTAVQNTSFSQNYIAITEKYRSDFNSGWNIKGDMIYDTGDEPISNIGRSVIGLIGCAISGSALKTGSQVFTGLDVYAWASTIETIEQPAIKLRIFNNCKARGNVNVAQIGQMQGSDIRGSLVITQGVDEEYDNKPLGIYFSNIEGDTMSVPPGITIDVDGTTWNLLNRNNVDIVGGGTIRVVDSGTTLGDLNDVDTDGATVGQVLKWDGSLWVADDETGGTDNNVDGVFWGTPPTANKTLDENGKRVTAATDEWSTVLRQPLAEEGQQKIYVEYIANGQAGDSVEIGIVNEDTAQIVGAQPSLSNDYVAISYSDSKVYSNGVEVAELTTTTLDITADQTLNIAFDSTTGSVWIGVNNVWDNGGDPENGTNPTLSLTPDFTNAIYYANPFTTGSSVTSPAPFAYEPPVGFSKLTSLATVKGRLGDLDDVTIVSATEPQFLGYDDDTSNWTNRTVNYADLGTKPTLDDIADVNTTDAEIGDLVRFNGTNWDNQPFPTITSTLEALTDTNIVDVQPNQGLQFNDVSGFWENTTIEINTSVSTLIDTNIGVRNEGDVLKWDGAAWINEKADWTELTGVPAFATVATSGSYNDLSDQPAIPTNTDFTFIDLADTSNTPVNNGILRWNPLGTGILYAEKLTPSDINGLATVAVSGSYTDLSDTPVLATVALSGSYDDLSDKPFIPLSADDLLDIDTSTSAPTNGQLLRWDGSNWIPSTEIDTNTLSNLTDTDINTPASAQVLRHNGTDWANDTLSYDDLSDQPDLSVYTIDTTLNPVAKSGSYDDLSDTPAIPVNSDFSVKGLSDTFSVSTPSGYLRWNATGTQVVYDAAISADNITGLSSVATSGSYDDLSNQPAIPTTLVQMTDTNISSPSIGHALRYNGVLWSNSYINYTEVAGTPNLTQYATKAELGTTAFTNSYNDLDSKPFIPVNSNFTLRGLSDTTAAPIANGYLKWNAAGTVVTYSASIDASSITGLHRIATTGDYNTLNNKPDIPTTNEIKDTAGTLVGVGSVQNGLVATYNTGSRTYDFDVNDPAITLAGAVAGSATMSNLNDVTISVLQQEDSVELGLHTTGNFVTSINEGDGISLTGPAQEVPGSTPTVNVDTTVIRTSGDQNISGNMQIDGNLVVTGELTTTIENEVTDPFMILNADSADTPLNNSGIKVFRGLEQDAVLQWNETTDDWELSQGAGVFYKMWHSNNDGAGSGLDADTLDGQHGSYYTDYNNLANRPNIPGNSDFSLVNLSDTSISPVSNGYLRWNGTASQVTYQTTIASSEITGLATVATSGSYNDLEDKPTFTTTLADLDDTIITDPDTPEVLKYNGFDWVNMQLDYSELSNLPLLFSGDYNDLANTPTNADYNLAGLGDVDITGLLPSDLLQWNGTKWVGSPSLENQAPAQTVYVSTNGDDAKNGSYFAPVATIKKAVEIAQALVDSGVDGVAVDVSPGLYVENNPVIVESEKIIVQGSGSESTTAVPMNQSAALFILRSTLANQGPALRNIFLAGGADNVNDPGSVGLATEGDGIFYTTRISIAQFNKGIDVGHGSTITTGQRCFADNSSFVGNMTGIYAGQTGGFFSGAIVVFSDHIGQAFHAENGGQMLGTSFDIRNEGTKALGAIGIRTGTGSVASYKQGIVDNCAVGAIADGDNSFTLGDGVQFSNNDLDARQSSVSAVVHLYYSLMDPSKVELVNLDAVKAANVDRVNGNFRVGRGTGLAIVTGEGELIVSRGNIGAPAIRFLQDEDTGVYSPGDNEIALVTDGAIRWSIDADGNHKSYGTFFINDEQVADVATSADYNDLINTPTNATYNLKDLSDTAGTAVANGYLRWNGSASSVEYLTTIPSTAISGLATVAESGDYDDLSNKPVNSDYNLAGLGDTNISAPQLDDTLLFDGAQWYNTPFPRTTDEIIYVSTFGNDVDADGSQFKPFLSVKAAVDHANSVSTPATPMTVSILPGVYEVPETIEMSNRSVSMRGLSPTTCLMLNTGNDIPIIRLTSDIATGGSRISAVGLVGALPTMFVSQSNFPIQTYSDTPRARAITQEDTDIASVLFGLKTSDEIDIPERIQKVIDKLLASPRISETAKAELRAWPEDISEDKVGIEVSGNGTFTLIDMVFSELGKGVSTGAGVVDQGQILTCVTASFTQCLEGISADGYSVITSNATVMVGNKTGMVAKGNSKIEATTVKVNNYQVKALGIDKGLTATTGHMFVKQAIIDTTTTGLEISSIGILNVDGASFVDNGLDVNQVNTQSVVNITNSLLDPSKLSLVNPANATFTYNDSTNHNLLVGSGNAIVEIDDVKGNIGLAAGSAQNPMVTVRNNNNTGMYSPGSNQLAFSVGGQKALTLLDNGTVQVGFTGYDELITNDNDLPNKKYVDDRVSTGGVSIETLPVIQTRRTSALDPLPTAWTDIVMSTTDVNTDSSMFELDSAAKQNINILEDGWYSLYYNASLDDEGEGRFVINGSAEIPGSYKEVGEQYDDSDIYPVIVPLTTTCYANLTAGQTITWQAKSNSAGESMLTGAHIIIQRAQGIRGAQGPAGANGGDTLASIQARLPKGVQFPVQGAWFSLPYNTVDIRTNPDVIDILPSGSEFEIKETDTYTIHYHLSASFPGDVSAEGRVLKNGNTELPGSATNVTVGADPDVVGVTFNASLSAGDVISTQFIFPGASGTATITGDAVLTISKMTGAAGPEGPQGPEGSGAIGIEDNGTPLAGTFTDVNFAGDSVTVTDEGAGRATVNVAAKGGQTASIYFADQLFSANSSGWAINNPALLAQDPTYPAILTRVFDSTNEMGVGFMYSVPADATVANFTVKGRHDASNTEALNMRLYKSEIPDGGTPSSWSTATDLVIASTTSDQNFHYYTFEFDIGDLGLNPGSTYQFELTRRGQLAGTSADFLMIEFQAEIV